MLEREAAAPYLRRGGHGVDRITTSIDACMDAMMLLGGHHYVAVIIKLLLWWWLERKRLHTFLPSPT